MATIADLVPEARNRAYDMTKIVRRLCDGEEIFEVKPRFGRTIDPAHTRDVIWRYLTMWDTRGAVGRHRLAAWPAKF